MTRSDARYATATASPVPGRGAAEPDPPRLRQARPVLLVEGVLLIALGGWAAVAAAGYHGAAPDGAPLLGMRFTMIHALVLLGTGVLAIAATSDRRAGLTFAGLQSLGYLLVFMMSADTVNAFSGGFNGGGDSVLHWALSVLGLVLVLWMVARTLGGDPVRRASANGSR